MVRGVRFLMVGAVASAALMVIGPRGHVDAGGGCHGPEANAKATEGDGTDVKMAICAFGPTVLRIDPGGRVTWTNTSEAPHTVTGLNGSWGDTKEVLTGDSVGYSFEAQGTFPYACALHPGMVGAVVVGNGMSGNVEAGSLVKAVPAAGPDSGDGSKADSASEEGDDMSATEAGLGAGAAGLAAGALATAWVLRRREVSE